MPKLTIVVPEKHDTETRAIDLSDVRLRSGTLCFCITPFSKNSPYQKPPNGRMWKSSDPSQWGWSLIDIDCNWYTSHIHLKGATTIYNPVSNQFIGSKWFQSFSWLIPAGSWLCHRRDHWKCRGGRCISCQAVALLSRPPGSFSLLLHAAQSWPQSAMTQVQVQQYLSASCSYFS